MVALMGRRGMLGVLLVVLVVLAGAVVEQEFGVQPSKEFDGLKLAESFTDEWLTMLADCAKKGEWGLVKDGAISVKANEECEANLESGMVSKLAGVLGIKRSSVIDEALWKDMQEVPGTGGYRGLNQEVLDVYAPMLEGLEESDMTKITSIIGKKVRLYMAMLEKPMKPLDEDLEAEKEEAPEEEQVEAKEPDAPAPEPTTTAAESPSTKKTKPAKAPMVPPAPVQPSKEGEPCADAVTSAENVDVLAKRVTPDYEDGPWYKNNNPHPFEARTHRPNIVRAIQLLKQVALNVAEVTKLAEAARAESIPVEEKLLSHGAAEVLVLETEILSATSSEDSFNQIKPTQSAIHDAVFDALTPELERISHLYQMDAEIRYPFAERSAAFTMDLTKATRTRDEVCGRLVDYMPPDQLNNTCAEFDAVVQNIRGKIDQEMQTATKVLNRNSAGLIKSTDKIDSVQEELSNNRQDLATFVEDGKDHVPGLKTVKQQALTDEKVMIRGIERVRDAQTHLLEQSQAIGESQLEQLQHVTVLLEALGMDATEPPEDTASMPASAHRTIQYDGEPSDAPIYARVNSPEVPMPPPPTDPEEA